MSSAASEQDRGPSPGTEKVELAVSGMHCASCVALIEEILTEQPGVGSATVDLESATAVVSFDSAQVGIDQLRSAVSEAGYTASVAS